MADGYNVVSKRPSKDSTGKMATACYGGAFAADESVIFRADFANTSGVPVPRWTDACPLPVLAMSLMLALGAVMILFMPVCYNGVVPFFGRLLSGWMGSTLCVLMVALWSYCAWAMYRLNPLGWALTVAGLGLMAGSASITFAQVDLIEMYRLMNYSEEQIRLIQHTGITNSPAMRILMIAGWVPMFGFLLYVKKFFQRVS